VKARAGLHPPDSDHSWIVHDPWHCCEVVKQYGS
jgi:hypothetical protein